MGGLTACRAGCSAREDISKQEAGVAITALSAEDGFEVIFEREVEGLGGEVTDDVGPISSPKGGEAFFTLTYVSKQSMVSWRDPGRTLTFAA